MPSEEWRKKLEKQLEGDGTPRSPDHYSSLKPQPIEVIEAWGLDFHRANVLKYLARAGKKQGQPEKDDLLKALFYLQRYIALRGY